MECGASAHLVKRLNTHQEGKQPDSAVQTQDSGSVAHGRRQQAGDTAACVARHRCLLVVDRHTDRQADGAIGIGKFVLLGGIITAMTLHIKHSASESACFGNTLCDTDRARPQSEVHWMNEETQIGDRSRRGSREVRSVPSRDGLWVLAPE